MPVFILKFFSLLSFLLLFNPIYSQKNISIGASSGIIANSNFEKSEKYGFLIGLNVAIEFGDNTGMIAEYSFSEFSIDNNQKYRINKYMLANEILFRFGRNDNFKMSTILGFSFLNLNDSFSSKNVLGFDFGSKFSYRIFDSMDIELNLMNTYNKSTKHLVQGSFGLRYYIKKQ